MRRVLHLIPALLLLCSLGLLFTARKAQTVPLYAARQGLMCGTCHFDPNGGGPRNELGFAYEKNRHSLVPEGEDAPWGDVQSLSNRVSDNVPIYFGVNQRVMLLANTTTDASVVDRFGFFNMENAMHLTIQPHDKLLLVYTNDGGFTQVAQTKEAFGMIRGLPLDAYLKVGRIRNPYGLRMDDHTVSTRNAFLDFIGGPRFLPYDPRNSDTGYEIGWQGSSWFGRAAFTNGGTKDPVFTGDFAEAKAVKIGYNHPSYQGAISVYENLADDNTYGRQARWGYYGMTHYGPVTLLGEVGAGTDTRQDGRKVNRLTYFGEVNVNPWRAVNFRFRYDHGEFDRSSDQVIRDQNTYDRYALESEWVPVPFAEFRLALRRIQQKEGGPGLAAYEENQGYLQVHFAY
jgi:hypothetical protein